MDASALRWTSESAPLWDENKARILGGSRAEAFDPVYRTFEQGACVPGSWWAVQGPGGIVGYGWLDAVWGDAEIFMATAPAAEGAGVGTFILDHLLAEAKRQGLNFVYNFVRPNHPDRERLTAWLLKRGFSAAEDGRLSRSTREAKR